MASRGWSLLGAACLSACSSGTDARAARAPGVLAPSPGGDVSEVIDGTGVCPYRSELGPALSRAFPGCHVYPPMDEELPLIACKNARPCLMPCRMTRWEAGAVAYVNTYRYDADGRLVEDVTRDARGTIVQGSVYAYPSPTTWTGQHEIFGVTSTSRTLRFDASGRLVEKVARSFRGNVLSSRYEYDASGRLLAEHVTKLGPDGAQESIDFPMRYDSRGRLLAQDRPEVFGGPEYAYTYGPDGKVETAVHHGVHWGFRRDAAGRVTELLDGGSPFERFAYDTRGRLAKVQAFHGGVASDARVFDYDCTTR